ncbi:hypothetical protein, partial [Roseibium sp. RKSG952]|uniref:hypothetical protein n=1 Tax=Roseibium sp. RKSG952 TaxID=2529384 RepID=UPI001AD8A880
WRAFFMEKTMPTKLEELEARIEKLERRFTPPEMSEAQNEAQAKMIADRLIQMVSAKADH